MDNLNQLLSDDTHFTTWHDTQRLNSRRGLNKDLLWLGRAIPKSNLVAIGDARDLEELLGIVKKTRHHIEVVSPAEFSFESHQADKYVVPQNLLQEIQPSFKGREADLLVLSRPGERASDPYLHLSTTNPQSFLKALARSLGIAPVHIISEDEKNAATFASFIDGMDTYFSVFSHSYNKFTGDNVRIPLPNEVILYLDDPLDKQTGSRVFGNDKRDTLLRMDAPLVYVRPTKFWRGDKLDAYFRKGLFDFVGVNISSAFMNPHPRLDTGESIKFLTALERIVNGLHQAFVTRDVYNIAPREAFLFARTTMPHILVYAPYTRSKDYLVQIMNKFGVNTQHIHIGRQHSAINVKEAIDDFKRIASSWNPNIIYSELCDDNFESQLGALKCLAKQLQQTSFVIMYDPKKHNEEVIRKKLGLPDKYFFAEKRGPYIRFERMLDLARAPNIALLLDDVWRDMPRKLAHYVEPRITAIVHREKGLSSLFLKPDLSSQLEQHLSSRFDFSSVSEPGTVYTGTGVFPGAASGRVYKRIGELKDELSDAIAARRRGENVIFYVEDLSKLTLADVKELRKFNGLVFHNVSEDNHHTIDLRRAGIPIVRVAHPLEKKSFFAAGYAFGDFSFEPNEILSFDGSTGGFYRGQFPLAAPVLTPDNYKIISEVLPSDAIAHNCSSAITFSADLLKKIGKKVMINADSIDDIEKARKWGVNSVGLVRSENVLKSKGDNLDIFAQFVSALFDGKNYSEKIATFVEMQACEFTKILSYQDGQRTQIRLLDPPLHEMFVLSDILHRECSDSLIRMVDSKESPRGAQFLRWPEIYEAQIRALFKAYKNAAQETGHRPDLKIFVPYVDQLSQVNQVVKMAEKINREEFKGKIVYDIGVTLETPGGCYSAAKMIKLGIKYFAFGTNDLFPLVDGTVSRGSASYKETKEGVLLLSDGIKTCLYKTLEEMSKTARESNTEIEVGLCGEMNEIKLHPYNLGKFLKFFDYFSAGRPQQIPVLMVELAKTFTALYKGSR